MTKLQEHTGKKASELVVGDKAHMSKTISESDVYMFAGITGDFNPAHINEEYAKETPFNTRIAHGMLGAGMISAVLGMKLPGPGTIYLSQELSFKKPVLIGDTITAEAEVVELVDKGKFVICEITTRCMNQHDEVVIEGKAKVIPPK
ncbi:MaoC family dehydratase [Cytobacillus spongiae]|uniref:MaoC family dehydratase n=1 Tax=Cytobacillus spongiae TaxID=2901381 RepID=UPI001F217A43|nr:MaoC family dehydratase [Cytobacillus spongiae]UII57606.1 MaoC family dehydratase [Cytobacillus spongiae]